MCVFVGFCYAYSVFILPVVVLIYMYVYRYVIIFVNTNLYDILFIVLQASLYPVDKDGELANSKEDHTEW